MDLFLDTSSFHIVFLGFFFFPLLLRILRAYTIVSATYNVLDKYLFDWIIVDQFHPLSCHLPSIPLAFSLGRKRQIIESKLAAKSRRKMEGRQRTFILLALLDRKEQGQMDLLEKVHLSKEFRERENTFFLKKWLAAQVKESLTIFVRDYGKHNSEKNLLSGTVQKWDSFPKLLGPRVSKGQTPDLTLTLVSSCLSVI